MSQLKAWTRNLPNYAKPGPSLGFDLVRAYLGIGLVIRGIMFVSKPELVMGYLGDQNGWFLAYAASHYVAIAHLGGGVLLTLGLATRLAALVQIPVLLGAVVLVHGSDGLLTSGQSLEFSALVLMLLGVYMVVGAGPLSVDAWLHSRQDETEVEEALGEIRSSGFPSVRAVQVKFSES